MAAARHRGRSNLTLSSTLRAYFDAGLQEKTRVYYVAGYVGFPDDWKVFDRKWRAFLRRNNLPHFHMTDYVARVEHYKGWSDSLRLAIMQRIVALVAGSVRLGVAMALLLDDYDRLSAEDKKLIPDTYGLCLTACVAKTARLLHDSGIRTAEIDYVFESGDAGQGRTRVALEELFANPATRKQYALRSLTFEPKASFPGLQLADVLAWETGRYVPRALGWESSPLRKSFRGLLENNQHSGGVIDYAFLSNLVARERERRAAAATSRVPGRGSPSASPSTS